MICPRRVPQETCNSFLTDVYRKADQVIGGGHSATKWCGRNAKERKQTWGASAKVGLKRKGGENAKVR